MAGSDRSRKRRGSRTGHEDAATFAPGVDPTSGASDALYRALFEQMASGFCVVELPVDPGCNHGRHCGIVEMNPAFKRLAGKRTSGEPLPADLDSCLRIHIEIFEEVLRTREPAEIESGFLGKDRVFNMSIFPFGETRVALVLADITAQKATERELSASESRFSELFNQMSTGVTVYEADESGRHFIIRDVNRAGENIDKVTREKIVGREVRDVFPGVVDFGLIDVLKQVWRTGKPGELSSTFYNDGRLSGWRENHVYRLPSGELVSLYRDVSELRLLERKIVSKQKMEAIGQLAGGVASDFNNILGLMSSYTSALTELVPPNSTAHQHARRLLEAEQYAGKLTKRLLSVARASVEGSCRLERVSLAKAITDTVSLMGDMLRRLEVKCSVTLPDPLPHVMVDDLQLRDALMNLILNSLKAMPEGGGRIRIDVDQRDIDVPNTKLNPNAKPGPYCVLRIRDTGHGIKKEILDRIFDPLFTTDSSGGSMGLGLSIVQSSVHMWGGWVLVRSREDAGASFRLFIPRVSVDVEGDVAATAVKTILAVDDQSDYLELIREALEQEGHNVIAVTNAAVALREFKRLGDALALSIVDAMLPYGSGRKLLHEMLAVDPTTSVIMTSGFSHDYVRAYLSRGAWGFLQKPFEARQVKAAVRGAIGS